MKTIYFKIQIENNPVTVEGYVEFSKNLEDEGEWYFWNGSQYNNHFTMNHEEIIISSNKSDFNMDFDEFELKYYDNIDYINEIILTAEEDENRTYVSENCTLIINEGAKMECEIKETNKDDHIVEVIPKFNGEIIDDFAEYMVEFGVEFDLWDNDGSSFIENGHIYFEMSKKYWDADFKDEILADVNEEARKIFARILTSRLGVYARYGEVIEQILDYDYDNDWLFKLSSITDDTLEDFLREQGLIDEKLE